MKGLRLLFFDWLCVLCLYMFGSRFLVIASDFGCKILPFWPIFYIGVFTQILVTLLILSKRAEPNVALVLNAVLLGYWGCLVFFLAGLYIDLTTGLQQIRR